MAHIPSRPVIAASDLALNLESADTFLAVEHLPENFEPDDQGILRVLKDRVDRDREPIRRLAAQLADPIERLPVELSDFRIATAGAFDDAVRPAAVHQEFLADIVGREDLHQLFERHHESEFSTRDVES